jgi:hypothetical protein
VVDVRTLISAVGFVLAAGSAAVAGQLCGREVRDTNAPLDSIQNKQAFRQLPRAGRKRLVGFYATSGREFEFWVFTRADHPAHPAFTCLQISPSGTDRWRVQQNGKCTAAKQACAAFLGDFGQLLRSSREQLRGRR